MKTYRQIAVVSGASYRSLLAWLNRSPTPGHVLDHGEGRVQIVGVGPWFAPVAFSDAMLACGAPVGPHEPPFGDISEIASFFARRPGRLLEVEHEARVPAAQMESPDDLAGSRGFGKNTGNGDDSTDT